MASGSAGSLPFSRRGEILTKGLVECNPLIASESE